MERVHTLSVVYPSLLGQVEKSSCPIPPCRLSLTKEFPSLWKVRRPMDRPYRRYEVLIPLRFNDGNPMPNELVADTLLELESQFGSVSCESQTTRGYWHHEGMTYWDELVRVYVDVHDEPANREFFVAFKSRALRLRENPARD